MYAFRLTIGRVAAKTPKSEILISVATHEGGVTAKTLAYANQCYTNALEDGDLGSYELDVKIERVDLEELTKKQRAELNAFVNTVSSGTIVLHQNLTYGVLKRRFGERNKPNYSWVRDLISAWR